MRFVLPFVLPFSLLGLAACQPEDPRVKDIGDRLERAEKRIDTLVQRPVAAAPQGRPQRPDPATVYHIPVLDDDVVRGPRHAKITIVEGLDFACPHCANARPVIEEVRAKHAADVRVVSKQFVIFPDVAGLPALAVCAAGRQGKGQAFEDAVWARAWTPVQPGRSRLDKNHLALESLEGIARDLGLDVARLKADLAGAECKAWIARHKSELAAVGVTGTPAFFVNGRPFQGPRTAEALSAFVADELKKADAALRGGTRLEDYYSSLMKDARRTL
jgi:protein-disulfide isomerase